MWAATKFIWYIWIIVCCVFPCIILWTCFYVCEFTYISCVICEQVNMLFCIKTSWVRHSFVWHWTLIMNISDWHCSNIHVFIITFVFTNFHLREARWMSRDVLRWPRCYLITTKQWHLRCGCTYKEEYIDGVHDVLDTLHTAARFLLQSRHLQCPRAQFRKNLEKQNKWWSRVSSHAMGHWGWVPASPSAPLSKTLF